MKYADFEKIINPARMNRYLTACSGNTKLAMTLYRKNLKLSQELFTVISCFEIALRNAIDKHYTATLGNNWLQDAAQPGGIFNNSNCRLTQSNINDAINSLNVGYTHNKLVAELGFGFWRYMFSTNQYKAAGQTLLQIFPAKPTSTPIKQYNANYIFRELAKLNDLRNRMAHHEPICFIQRQPIKNTAYARQHYTLIVQLFRWMQINEAALLYGLDHINNICIEIDAL